MVNARNSIGTSWNFWPSCALFIYQLFVSPAINIYIINASSDFFFFFGLMAVTLSFHLKPKIKKKINNIREINIMENFILIFRGINENCLLVALDLYLNPQDPPRICSCLTVRSLQRCSSHRRKYLLFSESYFLYIFMTSHFSLLYWVDTDSCTQIIRKDRHG